MSDREVESREDSSVPNREMRKQSIILQNITRNALQAFRLQRSAYPESEET
jgi:hypothetical protein